MKNVVSKAIIAFLFLALDCDLLFAQQVGEAVTGTRELAEINRSTHSRLDAFILKPVIRNGDIILLDTLDISDIRLGVLTANELKLLRNMYFAKHGYIFTTPDLTQYFGKFPWYKPAISNVDKLLRDNEKGLIDRIRSFENPDFSSGKLSRNDLLATWAEFNGGADQAGTTLALQSDGKFNYTYAEYFLTRTGSYKGTWEYKNNRIVLDVAEQDLKLGGYYEQDPDDIVIEEAVPARVVYSHNFIVTLPVRKGKGISGLPGNNTYTWLEIGTRQLRKKK